MTRICILDNQNKPLAYMDNSAEDALHYADDTLHLYLEGSASSFEFTVPTDHPDSRLLQVGNRVAFRHKEKDYYMSIAVVEQDDDSLYVLAYGLSFELINETVGKYPAEGTDATEQTFLFYANEFCSDVNDLTQDKKSGLKINHNEIAKAKRSLSWDGTETILARLFSLASKFDAEIEFVTHLNDDYSLKCIDLNVYKKHSDTTQGVGQKRKDVLRVGKDIEGITRRQDISNLCTAIRPIGKNGLTLFQYSATEPENATGDEILYYTGEMQTEIYAPKQRDRFPSNILEGGERYSLYIWNTDYESPGDLWSYGLAKLKEISVPQVTYEIPGYADVGIGDTINVADEYFEPPLYLNVRVTEQSICLTDRTKNKSVYSNVVEQEADTLTRIEEEMISLAGDVSMEIADSIEWYDHSVTQKVRELVAYPFNTVPGSTYDIGDYCIRNNKLYIAVAQTTSGSWIEAHWSETRVSDHMENADIHVSLEEKTYWNNKVSARYGNTETLFLEV